MKQSPFTADLIIHNARLYDPQTGFRKETALAVFRGVILQLGSDRDMLSLAGPASEVYDAGGKIVMPALTDSHTHFLGYVRRQLEVDLSRCVSLTETLHTIRERVDSTPEGGWVTGGGWNHNRWEPGEYPRRQLLDAISTRHYIALESKDWHTHWVNTPVLQLAGISTDRPYPGAKHLAIHPETGEFTGILEENARLIIFDLVPRWDYPRLRDAFRRTVSRFHRLGLTAIHTVETADEFRVYQQARRENELRLRVSWYLPLPLLSHARDLAIQQGLGDPFLQIAGVKLFVDGAFSSQTAELFDNYLGLPHCGVETLSESDLDEAVARAVAAGLSCAIHAIGDRAVHKTLLVLTKYREGSRSLQLRHRLEHLQLVREQDLPLIADLDLFASVQPLHLAYDIPVIEKYLKDRARFAYALASLKNAGATLIFGSDMPIEDFNPWHSMYTAMERKYQLDAQENSYYPEERLDLETCLRAYTINPAMAVGAEHRQGCVQAGWLADLMVPDRDIFHIPLSELKEVESVLTILNGQIVYRRDGKG